MSDLSDRRHTLILNGAASAVLEAEANHLGLELLDHLSGILTAHAVHQLKKDVPALAARLEAATRIKIAVGRISRRIAKEQGIQPDHTLRVFQALRQDPELQGDYLRATGCETGFEAGSPLKHSLNLALGAISKRAAGARVRKDINGNPEKIRNIRGEFCGSVTVLEPGVDENTEH
jgi:hypothetical protein